MLIIESAMEASFPGLYVRQPRCPTKCLDLQYLLSGDMNPCTKHFGRDRVEVFVDPAEKLWI